MQVIPDLLPHLTWEDRQNQNVLLISLVQACAPGLPAAAGQPG
jgi:hypothetical protein